MNASSVLLIHRLIAMGTTSLLQYVNDAVPWSPDVGHVAFTKVQFLAHEERDHVARLTRLLHKRHFDVPKMATYPSHFTTINFVSIDYLLPKLIGETEREIVAIQGWLQRVSDDEGRAKVQSYLDMKERHLQVLQDLAATKAGAA